MFTFIEMHLFVTSSYINKLIRGRKISKSAEKGLFKWQQPTDLNQRTDTAPIQEASHVQLRASFKMEVKKSFRISKHTWILAGVGQCMSINPGTEDRRMNKKLMKTSQKQSFQLEVQLLQEEFIFRYMCGRTGGYASLDDLRSLVRKIKQKTTEFF